MVDAANGLGDEEELPDRLQRVIINSIKKGVENLIRECEERRLNRMTVPVIGSGTLNLPKFLAIEALVGILTTKLIETPPQFLKEINIVTLEARIFDYLKIYLENLELEVSDYNEDDLNMSDAVASIVPSKLENRELILEDGYDSSENIAFEAIGEISSLKRELQSIKREISILDKENKKYSEEIKTLLKRNRELKLEIKLANRKIRSPEEVWLSPDLPLPLAYAQDILSSEQDLYRRYLLSIAAISIVHKYFFSLVCAEYKAAGCFNHEVNDLVNQRFMQNSVTEGSWHWLGLKIARAFKEENINGKVIADFVGLWFKEDGTWSRFSEVLKELIKLRNEIHDLVVTDNGWAKEWLARFTPLWKEMCNLSVSLLNYDLVFIDSIQNFLSEGRYQYTVKHLRGGYFIPQSGTLDLSERYNPEGLFLWNPVNDGMLPLSPFMVYEYSQVTNCREAFCLDHITQARFHFRAFRYPQFHYEDRRGVVPFSN